MTSDMQPILAKLLEHIYAAPERPGEWQAVLAQLGNAVGARCAALWHRDDSQAAASVDTLLGWDPKAVADYTGTWHAREVRMARIQSTREGGIFVDDRDMDFATIERSEVHNDFYRPHRLGRALAIRIFGEPDRTSLIGLLRPLDRGSYADREIRRAEFIAPHITRGLQLMRQVQRTKEKAEGLAGALDRFRMGVFLIDRAVRVLEMNRTAEALVLDPEAPLHLREGRLTLNRSDAQSRLAALLAGVRPLQSAIGAPPVTLRLPLPGGDALGLLAAPATRSGGIAGDGALVLLFVSDPRQPEGPDARLLMAEFGLSAAEAQVATRLAKGETAEAIATRRGVSRETVRTQIKNIYARAGAASQPELIDRFGRSLAALRGEG